jgi:hypothetical protein
LKLLGSPKSPAKEEEELEEEELEEEEGPSSLSTYACD